MASFITELQIIDINRDYEIETKKILDTEKIRLSFYNKVYNSTSCKDKIPLIRRIASHSDYVKGTFLLKEKKFAKQLRVYFTKIKNDNIILYFNIILNKKSNYYYINIIMKENVNLIDEFKNELNYLCVNIKFESI